MRERDIVCVRDTGCVCGTDKGCVCVREKGCVCVRERGCGGVLGLHGVALLVQGAGCRVGGELTEAAWRNPAASSSWAVCVRDIVCV